MRRILGNALIGLLALACGAGAARGQEWTRVRAPHFEVVTDAGEKRGKEIAVRFEQMRRVFEKLLSAEKLNTPIPLQILAFRGAKEFDDVAPLVNGKPQQNLAGFFQSSGDMNFIALNLSRGEEYPLVYHEYSHSVLHGNFRHIPLWFDEGLATYYQTIKIEKGHVQIGASPKYADTFLYHRALMPVTQLFSVTTYAEDDIRETLLGNESWAVVHYLFDKQKMGDFAKYMELTTTQSVPMPAAIEQACEMTPKELDLQIAAYLNMALRQVFNIDDSTGVDNEKIVAEPLEQNDAAAMIANMHFHSRDHHEEAIQEYKAVLATNPNQVDANLGLGYDALLSGKYEEAEIVIRKGVSLQPKNARGQFLLGILQLHRDSTDANRQEHLIDAWNHLKAAAMLSPELAEVHNLLASTFEQMGNVEQAIKEATVAARLNQGAEGYFVHLAELYVRAKKYEQAESVFEQLAASNNPTISSLANKRLEELKAADGQQKAQTPKE